MSYLPRPLTDDDYVVIDEAPTFIGQAQSDQTKPYSVSSTAVMVYCPEFEEHGTYLCRECKQYLSDTVRGVHSHMKHHVQQKRSLVPEAFALLPEPVQANLLARAAAAREAS